jgi:hypothetical protein
VNAALKPRLKRCKVCLTDFTPKNSLQATCFNLSCAIHYGKVIANRKAAREKREARKETRAKLVKLMTARDWTKLAQVEFNRFIRERDAFLPCISCGTQDVTYQLRGGFGWDCSHYRSIGANPELRFEELNAAKSCKKCNRDMSGNIVNFRITLLQRIGAEKLSWLEGPHEPKRYRIEELIAIRDLYRAKVKHLKWLREQAASFA